MLHNASLNHNSQNDIVEVVNFTHIFNLVAEVIFLFQILKTSFW